MSRKYLADKYTLDILFELINDIGDYGYTYKDLMCCNSISVPINCDYMRLIDTMHLFWDVKYRINCDKVVIEHTWLGDVSRYKGRLKDE